MLRALVARGRGAAPAFPPPAAAPNAPTAAGAPYAAPNVAPGAVPNAEPAGGDATARLVDAACALVHLVGACAVDAGPLSAAATARAADRWRRHLAFGAPRPAEEVAGDGDPPAASDAVAPAGPIPARDWEGAVRFASAVRRAEHAHVAHALAELRHAVDQLVHGLHAVVRHEAEADDAGAAALGRVRAAVADPDPEALRRAARAAVEELGALAARRARSREARVAELGAQLTALDAALDAARRDGATDALTGLGNRRALDDALARAADANGLWRRPAALVLFDVDGLKAANDRHGHAAGDEVLGAVAGQLARTFLGRGDALARHGGDEFAAVLPDASSGDAERLARRVVAGVAEAALAFGARWGADGGAAPFGVSAGVAAHRPGEAPAEWMARADAALYRAKRAGKGTVATG